MMTGVSVPVEARVKYLTRRRDEIQKMKQSLGGEPDWDLMTKVGHQVKGNAITFDFEVLTSLGKRLEDAARDKDSVAVRQCLKEMEEKVGDLMSALAR